MMSATAGPVVIVAAAVVEQDGRLLVTRRLAGTHLACAWEFPGGKCEPDEAPDACLRREMREELDVGFVAGDRILVTRHVYAERTVELHFYRGAIDRAPTAVLGQDIRWVSRTELGGLEFPDADRELIELLAHPS